MKRDTIFAIDEETMPSVKGRTVLVCDYVGYACKCDGYKKARPGTTLCVCGHARSQHQRRTS